MPTRPSSTLALRRWAPACAAPWSRAFAAEGIYVKCTGYPNDVVPGSAMAMPHFALAARHPLASPDDVNDPTSATPTCASTCSSSPCSARMSTLSMAWAPSAPHTPKTTSHSLAPPAVAWRAGSSPISHRRIIAAYAADRYASSSLAWAPSDPLLPVTSSSAPAFSSSAPLTLHRPRWARIQVMCWGWTGRLASLFRPAWPKRWPEARRTWSPIVRVRTPTSSQARSWRYLAPD